MIRIDKRLTPFLLKAIEAASQSDFVSSGMHDIESLHIAFEDVVKERDGLRFYLISFFAQEVEPENWMTVTVNEVGGVHVEIEVSTRHVIRIYADR